MKNNFEGLVMVCYTGKELHLWQGSSMRFTVEDRQENLDVGAGNSEKRLLGMPGILANMMVGIR